MSPHQKSSKNLWNAFLALTAIGWINGLVSLWHRQKINSLSMDSSSFCNISEAVNCDTVALSKYSEFLGVPTASWGMLLYAVLTFVGLWAYFKRSDGDDEKAASGAAWLFAISAIALVPTLALAAISFFSIGSLCLLCMVTYAINIALAVISYRLYSSTHAQAPKNNLFMPMLRDLGQAGWIVAALVLVLHVFSGVIVGRMATGGPEADDRLIPSAIQSYAIASPKTFTVAGYPSFGPENAPVTVIEFSDFQCPFCARSSVSVQPLLKAYGDKIRYVYKPYPLDSACNPQMNRSVHPLACSAAKAGQCVFDKKGGPAFFAYKKKVFDDQPNLSIELIKQFATESELAAAELETCMADPAVNQKIVDSVKEGSTNGVQGTPAIFINGRSVDMHPKTLRAVLEHAINGG